MTASGRSRSSAASAGSKSATPRTSTGISTIPAAGAAVFISVIVATFEALSGLMRKATRLHIRDRLAQHLQPLGAEVGAQYRVAGDVSAGAGEAADQARAYRIPNTDHHDGNGRRRRFGGLRRRRAKGR